MKIIVEQALGRMALGITSSFAMIPDCHVAFWDSSTKASMDMFDEFKPDLVFASYSQLKDEAFAIAVSRYPNSAVISIGDVNQKLINPILSINNTSKDDMPNIEFEGGEPSNSPNFWKFINFLKTLDAKHLRISLASNLCPSNNYDLDKFKDLPKYFKQIKITGSVENIGKIAEFTRYGTRWHDIKPNIIKLMDLGIHLSFSATISALTVLNYDQFLEWQSQSGLKMYNHKTMVKEPEFQSIDVLPRHIRLKCSDKIANVLQKNKSYFDYHNTFEKLQSISDALRVPNKPDVRLQQDLKNFFIQYCDLTKNSHDILGKEFADWIHSVK